MPVTRGILPIIRRHLETGKLFEHDRARVDNKLLRDFFDGFLPGLKSIPSDDPQRHPLITDVLSLVDHLLVSDVSVQPNLKALDLVEARRVLESAILMSIQKTRPKNAKLCRRLARWIVASRKRAGHPTAVVSTNYDTLLDMKVYNAVRRLHPKDKEDWEQLGHKWIDFGFNWRKVTTGAVMLRPDEPDVGIFKLHGSLNWLACPMCSHIYVNRRYNIFRIAADSRPTDDQRCDCNFIPTRRVIVAPSMVRSIRDSNLLAVWQAALEALRHGGGMGHRGLFASPGGSGNPVDPSPSLSRTR